MGKSAESATGAEFTPMLTREKITELGLKVMKIEHIMPFQRMGIQFDVPLFDGSWSSLGKLKVSDTMIAKQPTFRI